MELRDFLVTPILLFMVYGAAYVIKPWVTDDVNRAYFIPALSVKIIGAIALGIIYQFYYSGGDTYNFHTYGSRHVWQAFMEAPATGVEMMLSSGEHKESFFRYSSRIPFFTDSSSYFVIRVAAFFDLFTYSTYSATAVCFAVLSFAGMWMFFLMFYNYYPHLHKWLALACFFVPSVFFWGSGLLKDTLMMGCLGAATYLLDRLFLQRKFSLLAVVILLISLYCIFSVKKFILQAYLPSALLWIYLHYANAIKQTVLKLMIIPFILFLIGFSSYYSVVKIGEGDRRFAVEKLAETARITAYDIRYYTGRDAGSGYSIGELDGSMTGLIKLAPSAINVSLFRPYLWEVKNPLMLLSALESFLMLLATVFILVKRRSYIFRIVAKPDIIFCFVFAIGYAFAVGVSTFNFGTLVRYKIPLLPFFIIGLILAFYSKSDKNVGALADNEN